MSSLSPEPTQPELSGLTVILGSGGYLASGIAIAGGANVSGGVTVSGNVNVSGLITVSGYAGIGPLSGFLFAGFSGAAFLSGAGAVSGAIPVVPMIWDFSGKQWVQMSTAISGSTVLQVWQASGNVMGGVNVSGGVTISGLVGVSGGGLTISGGVTVSGGVTISGLVVISGFASVSGLFSNLSGAPLQSSATLIAPQFKRLVYPGLSGLYNTAASSVGFQSGGFALSSSVCNTVTIRNWSGNNPIFVGYSGYLPTSGGYGFVLYGGDGLTVDFGPNMNMVSVVAQTSGTLISHFSTQY